MDNETYFKNIYRARAEIDALDEAHWSKETFTDEEIRLYELKRIELCDILEAAFKSQLIPNKSNRAPQGLRFFSS